MYKKIYKELVPAVLEAADKYALNERANYKIYADIIEGYIQEHKLIAGEQTGIDLLIGRPFHKNSYPFTYYAAGDMDNLTRAEYDGRAIGDLIYEKTKNPYIMVSSMLDGAEVKVDVYDRTLLRIVNLPDYKGADLSKLADPTLKTGWFNHNVYCMNTSVQLARIYRQLSSPVYVDNWDQLLIDEKDLRAIFLKECCYGGDDAVDEGSMIIGSSLVNPEYDLDEDNEIFTEYIYAGDDEFPRIDSPLDIKSIVINLGGIIITFDKRIQVTNLDPEELETTLKKYMNVQKTVHFPRIPGDEQLRRYTFYEITTKKKVLLELFNIASYDPIPVKDNYAHYLVKMRIIIIDIWTINLILSIGQIDANFAKMRLKSLFDEYKELCCDIDVYVLAQNYDYVGIAEKDQYQKSKKIRQMRNKSDKYLPKHGAV